MKKDDLLQAIKELSVMDLADLVKALEEEFGVSAAVAAAPAAGAAPAAAAAPAAEAAEEQTEFKVTLKDAGANKINVIKAVREITALGLREAKELVESAPATVKEGLTKEDAAELQKKLEEAGATVSTE